MSEDTQEAKGWCVLELMGHRLLAGWVSDDDGLLRIDVYLQDPDLVHPDTEDGFAKPIATQWYGRAAIYCITASTAEMCTRLSQSHQPAPVGRWELPQETSAEDGVVDAELDEDLDAGWEAH